MFLIQYRDEIGTFFHLFSHCTTGNRKKKTPHPSYHLINRDMTDIAHQAFMHILIVFENRKLRGSLHI